MSALWTGKMELQGTRWEILRVTEGASTETDFKKSENGYSV